MTIDWRHLTKAQLDFELSPSRSAKDFMSVLKRHEFQTAQVLADRRLNTKRNLQYGPAPAQRLDLILPDTDSLRPCVLMIHGGFWQEGDKAVAGFASRALADAGVGSALAGYTLAPHKGLSGIAEEIAACVDYLSNNAAALGLDQNKLIIAGHSAGAYLAANLLAKTTALADKIAGAMLISGVYDLAPIAASYVNEVFGMTATEAKTLSLHQRSPRTDAPVHILVGADEPAAFIVQSECLYSGWSKYLSNIRFEKCTGRDHFDILDELTDPKSPSHKRLLEMTL
ncbi:hypothetical protein AB833_13410 [Chromatiales bacterium (ex Bugula neritina AB1)]|nr:hypothetical protein AB833_13410 [Chromatiales bacterium (ex Bugula neritina AB1)]